MFRMIEAETAAERMSELERFIEWWYGPRKPEYGEPEDMLYDLPGPLRRFYAFAGRWPSPASDNGMEYFYTGAGGHHLQSLDMTSARRDLGMLNFFIEYQGDWLGLSEHKGEDPPVWIEGPPEDVKEEEEEVDDRPLALRKVSNSLSGFLITHTLMTTIYEHVNSRWWGSFDGGEYPMGLVGGDCVRIWSAEDCLCPNYDGVFDLYEDVVLVHRTPGGSGHFATVDPKAVDYFRSRRIGSAGHMK